VRRVVPFSRALNPRFSGSSPSLAEMVFFLFFDLLYLVFFAMELISFMVETFPFPHWRVLLPAF